MADVEQKTPQRVVVEIFGDSYPLRTDDPERLKKLAAGLDHLMKKMAGSVKSFDGTKIRCAHGLYRSSMSTTSSSYDYDELVELLDEK